MKTRWMLPAFLLITASAMALNASPQHVEGPASSSRVTASDVSLKASDPSPPDGATGVTKPLLEWTAGATAAIHDVYFGTSPNLGPADFVMRHPAQVTLYWRAPRLIPGQQYYWRVDEVQADSSVVTGDVWTFRTTPRIATNPTPPNGAILVNVAAQLTWTAGFDATFHEIYFGTDRTMVAGGSAQTFKGGEVATTYDPGVLRPATTYYWRINAVELDGTRRAGDVWHFITEGSPEAPVYYVDANNGSDDNDGLSPATALATIQRGIDLAADGDTILVYPGVYTESIHFMGKAITVQSTGDAATIQAPDDIAVSFLRRGSSGGVLKNFVIANSYVAVLITHGSPTLTNLTVAGNEYGIEAYAGSEPTITNCIFWNNPGGDLYGCQADYSWVQEQIDPAFPDGLYAYWNFNETQGQIAEDAVSGFDGVVHGADWVHGWSGGGLAFDGAGDYVELPAHHNVWLPSGQFTLALWVYFERAPGPHEMILDLNSGGSINHPSQRLGYFLDRRENGGVAFYLTTGDGHVDELIGTTALGRGRWYHLAVVRESRSVAMYINGDLEGRMGSSPEPVDWDGGYNDYLVNIAQYTADIGVPRHHLQGMIDELMIFDRALSKDDVELLHTQGIQTFGFRSSPLFADPANGDYHLRSERGRYWPQHDVWILDEVTSPCVDAGDPAADHSAEPIPNGGRINIGAYGGTAYASMSDRPWLDSDINRDGVVNMLDFARLADDWLKLGPDTSNQPPQVTIVTAGGHCCPCNVVIEAGAHDPDGVVVEVEFFVNEHKIGQDNDGTDRWQTTWPDCSTGTHTVIARATDNDGATAISEPVQMRVRPRVRR